MGLDGILADLFKVLKDAAANVLYSIYKQIWKTQQWPRGWKRSGFITIPKKCNAKEYSNYCTILFISHAGKVMLKTLPMRLQQYVNQELPNVKTGFRKGRGSRDQIVNICWIIEKARALKKKICFIDYAKAFDCVDHNKLWNILKEMGVLDHPICLLRNLYAGQEERELDMEQWIGSKLGKEDIKAIFTLLIILYAEYVMRNTRLDEAQARTKIARRNINNLRDADEITLWQKVKN